MASAFQGPREKGKRRLLIRAETGSTAWGVNLDNQGDRDELAVCIEGLPEVVGFNSFEQEVYRSAAVREGKADARSQTGDLDLVTYSLRKWMRLALKGNPTILTLLFVPRTKWVDGDGLWEHIQFLTPKIVSKQAGKAFLGYLQAQRMRLLGERGGLDVHRKELEEKYGYDTKYAMHMLRLGYQGIELLSTGTITMPLPGTERDYLLGVRRGESSRQDVLTRCGELEAEIKDLLTTSPLPDEPDHVYMEKYMNYLYWATWLGNYAVPDWSLQEDMDFVPVEWEDGIHEYFRKVRGGRSV